MEVLRRSQIVFNDLDDLAEQIMEAIVECEDDFGELDTQDSDLVDIAEDLTSMEVWEVVEVLCVLLEQDGDLFYQFVEAALERWEFAEPEFCQDVRDALKDDTDF